MKSQFVIFLSVAITVWVVLNALAYRSVRGIFPEESRARTVLLAAVIILGAAYFAGRFLERQACSDLSKYLIIAGSYYMGLMIYACVGALFADIAFLSVKGASLIRPEYAGAVTLVKKYSPFFVAGFAVLLSGASFINAHVPRHTVLNLHVDKDGGSFKTLRIAAATDVHLGHIISNGRLDALVRSLNAIDADVIIFGGDLIDEDLKPVVEADMGKQLLQLKARYGVFAVYGNHEYIGGAKQAAEYLATHNITLLADAAFPLADSVYLVGRDDYSSNRFGGVKRLPLAELMKKVDKAKPVILIDHQPHELGEAERNGADLQLSGHTHHGQFWPVNFITSLIYEVSSGFKMKGKTAVYVSNGYGTWGTPMRMGNRPEFIEINLTFR